MDLLDPGIKPGSPALQVDSLLAELLGKPKSLGHTLEPSLGTSHGLEGEEQARGGRPVGAVGSRHVQLEGTNFGSGSSLVRGVWRWAARTSVPGSGAGSQAC